MRIAAPVELDPEHRAELEHMARQRSLPARVVERARIVLRAADGLENKEIAAQMGIWPEKVARWRNRYVKGGIAALEKDAPRPGRKRIITERVIKKIIEMTLHRKPPKGKRWTARTMAAKIGICESSVWRVWHDNGVNPKLVGISKPKRTR